MRILISDYEEELNRDLTYELQLLKEHFPNAGIEVYAYHDKQGFLEKMKEPDVLLTAFLPVDQSVFQQANRLKVISINATGYGNVDMKQAKDHHVKVVTVQDYCTNEVADHTMALLLALERNLKIYERNIEQRYQWQYLDVPSMKRLSGQTLAIFGLGRIGRAVAKRAGSFGIQIIAVDPYVTKEDARRQGIGLVTKREAFQEADIISNHMNQTKDNENYFDAAAFDLMLRHPIFLNVGRGSTVQEEDLVMALEQGKIRAAGLDVLKSEEPNLRNHPLVGRKNVILTPHAAFYSEQSMRDLQRISCENIIKEMDGYGFNL